MNNCLNCRHSYVEDIWKPPSCKLKNHEIVEDILFEPIGKSRLESGELVDCEDGMRYGD